MRKFSYIITAPGGIHAVPAALLAQEAEKYDSFVTVAKGTVETDMTKPFQVMAMAIGQGDTVGVCIEGEDEELAAAELEAFFCKYL